ncbi:MAG: hypothetical protein HQ483_00655 [Rhodospirillales bacterium]|nr:hypothetical protein [Rhodospirillales bacterium]
MRTPPKTILIPLMFAVVALTTPLLISTPASAQAVCGLRPAVLKQLQGNYKEAPVSMGLASNGSVLEITRSDTGSWSILLTNPSGVTCLMAAGENWESVKSENAEYNPS